MSVSARLDEDTDALLARAAKTLRTTTTDVLKRSMRSVAEESSMRNQRVLMS